MDIHKPKPWHGVREFLKEYVIIVVGVLTALGAEQGVEWLHWRQVTAEAREAIIVDQRHLMQEVGATDIASGCALRRLNELKAALEGAEGTGRLPAVAAFGPPPNMPWLMRGWDTVVSGQTLPHFSHQLAMGLSAQAFVLDLLRGHRDGLAVEWAGLTMLTGPGRRIDPTELAAARAALGRAYWHAARQRTSADAFGEQVIGAGLLDRKQAAAEWRKGADDYARSRNPNVCRSSDPAALDFNQAILAAPAHAPARDYDYSSVGPAGVR